MIFIRSKTTYNRFNSKQVPFIEKLGASYMNGTWDVTDTKEFLGGIQKGNEEIRLKDYLVYRPVPKAFYKLGEKPKVHPQSYEMQVWYKDIYKALTEGVKIDKEYYNPFFVFWMLIFRFEIPMYDKKGNPLEGSEINGPVYSTIDRYIFDVMWRAYKKREYVGFMSGRGLGKHQSNSTLVPTPSGEVLFGNLKIGDDIFTTNGEITKVKNIQENGKLDLYKVFTGDRRSTNCSTGHLWEVYQHNKKGLQIVEAIEVKENLKYENKSTGRTGHNYFLPISGEVEFIGEKIQLVDPYLFGYLLGDGSYVTGGCRVATDDECVIDSFRVCLGDDYELNRDFTCNNYYIKYLGKARKIDVTGKLNRVNPFTESLRNIGAFGKNSRVKRIPKEYKEGSKEQRMSLVQGMMDADGYAYKDRASAEYYSVNKLLIEDLAWVIRSLGIKCMVGEDVREGEIMGYRLFIYTGRDIFRIPRKLSRLKKDNEVSNRILNFRYRTAITNMTLEKSSEEGRCIEVEHKRGTYLTSDFITTHNSFITSAIEAWYYSLFDKQELIISATSEPIVEEAWSKFRDTIDLIEEEFPGFHQKRIINSTKRVIAGEEYYDNNGDLKKRGSLNDARRIIYGDNANVTRGRRPHFQHVEEFASFPSHPSKGSLKNVLGQSKGSWLVMGSIKKAFVIMTGTGGSVDNKDAEDVFTNPKGFNMFSCEEWGKETSLFIPSYLKYGGTWEGVGTPNLELALDLITIKRKTLENDPVSYIKELQEFPISLDEVFIVHGLNIFNQDKIAEQLAKLKISKEKPWEVGKLEYVMNPSGKVVGVKFVKSPDGKIIIVEHPQTEKDGTILNNLYVTGIDSIDQGGKDSLVDGSKLAAAVKKRISGNMFSETSNLYVAFYNERSDDVRWDYENVLKIMMYYNSKANLEYTKINIVSFFRDKGQLWRLLKRPSIAIGANISGIKASQLIGTPATPSVISHQDQKWADYIDDYYYQIMYPPVLEQSRDYDRNNRTKYDFVVACGLTELADEDFLGKPASKNEKASDGLTDFGFYMDKRGKRRWGEIPKKEEELRSIAEETIKEMVNEENLPFRWVDSSSSMP